MMCLPGAISVGVADRLSIPAQASSLAAASQCPDKVGQANHGPSTSVSECEPQCEPAAESRFAWLPGTTLRPLIRPPTHTHPPRRMPSSTVGRPTRRLDIDLRDQAPTDSPHVREYPANVCFSMLEDAEHSAEVYRQIERLESKKNFPKKLP